MMPTLVRADRRAHFLLQRIFLTLLQNCRSETPQDQWTPGDTQSGTERAADTPCRTGRDDQIVPKAGCSLKH